MCSGKITTEKVNGRCLAFHYFLYFFKSHSLKTIEDIIAFILDFFSCVPCRESNREDARGYNLCDLYRIRLTNSGDPVTLMGTMKTIYSNYESDNLKFQLFTLSGSTYTEISDMITIDHDTNSQNSFVLEDIAIGFSLTDGNTTNQISDYYLAIWLSDAEYNQLEDQDKVYEGNIMFTSDNGGVVTADFVLGGLSHVSLPRSSSGNEHSDM